MGYPGARLIGAGTHPLLGSDPSEIFEPAHEPVELVPVPQAGKMTQPRRSSRRAARPPCGARIRTLRRGPAAQWLRDRVALRSLRPRRHFEAFREAGARK